MRAFELHAPYEAAGDQPAAIARMVRGLDEGAEFQTLAGCTGTGKTYMMASVIAERGVPALVLSPNKLLAAQLYGELRAYFPTNRVEFFVSHFKHFQPESYLPGLDRYIAKSSSVDADIDRLRHAATRSLFERPDTIVVASVSCIYGLGLPQEYLNASTRLSIGAQVDGGAEGLAETLRDLYFERKDDDIDKGEAQLARGSFRCFGGGVDVAPPWEKEGTVYRIRLRDDATVVSLHQLNGDGTAAQDLGADVVLYPARHFATPKDRLERALGHITRERDEAVAAFRVSGKPLEAQRLDERVTADIDMFRKVGFCSGAENYSLHLSGRSTDEPPDTLLDYMPRKDWLLFVDESHVTVPQLSAMSAGNVSRKRKLITHGFRLPSSIENRPLTAEEFWQKAEKTIFVSATPGPFELERCRSRGVVEAVIRPTGVLDPTTEVVKTAGQIEHLTRELAHVVKGGGRAIVTTITKQFAEDLADCLAKRPPVPGVLERQLSVTFLHSGIDSVGRIEILEALKDRERSLDVVVGVNLLREGIDLPTVSLVAIMDADKEGFLRGETALIQMIGRSARNVKGHVIMYADIVTSSMQRAIAETSRRRRLQIAYNKLHSISPLSISNSNDGEETDTLIERIRKLRVVEGGQLATAVGSAATHTQAFGGSAAAQVTRTISTTGFTKDGGLNEEETRERMLDAANRQDFETAALLRDRLRRHYEDNVGEKR